MKKMFIVVQALIIGATVFAGAERKPPMSGSSRLGRLVK
jgi:hypothetical protein